MDANVALFVWTPLSPVDAVTIFGALAAVIVYYVDRRRAQRAREFETYQRLQSSYYDFMNLCIERHELGLLPYNDSGPIELTPAQQDQRLGMLEMLVSLLESAYFHYHLGGHAASFMDRQAKGWDDYMEYWASRPDFQQAWNTHLGGGFDKGFVEHMQRLVDAEIATKANDAGSSKQTPEAA